MNRVRVGFLLPRYASGSTSHMPRVMQLLSGLGVAVDVILPADGSIDLSTVRVEHDLHV